MKAKIKNYLFSHKRMTLLRISYKAKRRISGSRVFEYNELTESFFSVIQDKQTLAERSRLTNYFQSFQYNTRKHLPTCF